MVKVEMKCALGLVSADIYQVIPTRRLLVSTYGIF